jgi:hypothetical protein
MKEKSRYFNVVVGVVNTGQVAAEIFFVVFVEHFVCGGLSKIRL